MKLFTSVLVLLATVLSGSSILCAKVGSFLVRTGKPVAQGESKLLKTLKAEGRLKMLAGEGSSRCPGGRSS